MIAHRMIFISIKRKRTSVMTKREPHHINESAQDIEYHYTPLHALEKMMETDTFNLNDVEKEKRGGYHMSLTRMRSSRSGFGYDMARNAERFGEPMARIELDGRKLNNVRNIKVRPYDYNYNEFRDVSNDDGDNIGIDVSTLRLPQRMHMLKQAQEGSLEAPYNPEEAEAEDSLTLTKGDQITDASEYIRRIDVYLPSRLSDRSLRTWDRFIRQSLPDYPDWSDKMHFFTDIKSFDFQLDDKALDMKSLPSLYSSQYAYSLTEGDLRKMVSEAVRKIMKRL